MYKGQDSRVLVIGGAGIDVKGKPARTLMPGTSNPGQIRMSVGGGARNIAENLARLGVEATLLAAVGGDSFGRMVLERSAQGGVDVSHVIIDSMASSAFYVAVLDVDGSLCLSIDDMRIISRLDRDFLYSKRALFRAAHMVVVDASLNPKALSTVFQLARQYGVPVCANPVSVSLAARLKPRLKDCAVITPNQSEAEVLAGMTIDSSASAIEAAHRLVAAGVGLAVIAMGSEGVVFATSSDSGHVPSVVVDVVDSTGGGDTLTATLVYGLVNDFPVDEAVRLGVSAAALTITSPETVSPDLNLENLYQAILI